MVPTLGWTEVVVIVVVILVLWGGGAVLLRVIRGVPSKSDTKKKP